MLAVLVDVAEAIALAIVVIVEELTPPTVFTLGSIAVPPKSPAIVAIIPLVGKVTFVTPVLVKVVL